MPEVVSSLVTLPPVSQPSTLPSKSHQVFTGQLSQGYPLAEFQGLLIASEQRRVKGTRGIVPGSYGSHKICVNARGLSQQFVILKYIIFHHICITITPKTFNYLPEIKLMLRRDAKQYSTTHLGIYIVVNERRNSLIKSKCRSRKTFRKPSGVEEAFLWGTGVFQDGL